MRVDHGAWCRDWHVGRHGGNADVIRQELASELGSRWSSLDGVASSGLAAGVEDQKRATIRFEAAPGNKMQIDCGGTKV